MSSSGLHENTTLGDLKRLLGKEFICIGTNLNNESEEILGSTATPTVRVCDAIYMSCCIPFVFTPTKHMDSLVIDGSLVCNQPVVFPINETLFWSLTTKKPTLDIHTWPDYVNSVFGCSISVQKKWFEQKLENVENKDDIHHIVFEPTDNVNNFKAFDYYIKEEEVNTMIACGYQIVLNSLTQNRITNIIIDILKIFITIRDNYLFDDI